MSNFSCFKFSHVKLIFHEVPESPRGLNSNVSLHMWKVTRAHDRNDSGDPLTSYVAPPVGHSSHTASAVLETELNAITSHAKNGLARQWLKMRLWDLCQFPDAVQSFPEWPWMLLTGDDSKQNVFRVCAHKSFPDTKLSFRFTSLSRLTLHVSLFLFATWCYFGRAKAPNPSTQHHLT